MANMKMSELSQIDSIATGDKLLITDISEPDGSKSKQITVQQLDDRYLAFNPISVPYGEMWQHDNAVTTPMPVQNDWYKVENFVQGETNVVTYADNSLTLPLGIIHVINVTVSAVCSANEDFNFAVFKNGVQVEKLTVFRRFDANKEGNLSITGLLAATAGDVIDLRVQQTTDDQDITIINSNFNTIGI